VKLSPGAGRLLVGLTATTALLGGCGQSAAIRPTGTVVGGIAPCGGASRTPLGFVAGTVVALRGSETTRPIAPGEFRSVLPHTEVARQTVGDGQEYRFALRPGHYVLRVVQSQGASELPIVGVTIVAKRTVRANMPDACK
jgi:hypothetical protein